MSSEREQGGKGNPPNSLKSLDFAPDWARVSPEDHSQSMQSARSYREERDFDKGSDRRGGSGFAARREARHPLSRRRRSGDGPSSRMRDEHSFEQQRVIDTSASSPPEELPLEIRVLPDPKALGAIIRRVQASSRAYPLRDTAMLFLDKPVSCLIRIELKKSESNQPQPAVESLYQCKACGMPGMDAAEIRSHLLSEHWEDFFEMEEVECAPPSGAFVSVMRCGLSGTLLGPPNHHSCNERIHEMLRTTYRNMSEDDYRSRIESVREPELIEQWRHQCSRTVVFKLKEGAVNQLLASGEEVGEEGGGGEACQVSTLERQAAEAFFEREIVPAQTIALRRLVCPLSVARLAPNRALRTMIVEIVRRERNFPGSLMFAMRGAFRHRKLYVFRANNSNGPEFVMSKPASQLDQTHTVAILRETLAFVREHAACTRSQLVKELGGSDQDRGREILTQLSWLIERGHLIEYYNEVLSIPTNYPAFRKLPREKKPPKDRNATPDGEADKSGGSADANGEARREPPHDNQEPPRPGENADSGEVVTPDQS